MQALTCHTAPCIRHVLIRHAQSTKNIIEEHGDMTTKPPVLQLTPDGASMVLALRNGLVEYLKRVTCDPNTPRRFYTFTHDGTPEAELTYNKLDMRFDSSPPEKDGILVAICICSSSTIVAHMRRLGISCPVGPALGSATIYDELDDSCFLHAIGDLGIMADYPLSKVRFWNNAP